MSSMSCNCCGTKFNFFHKEMGCSNCGLSFCNKCLKRKCKLPSRGNGDLSICRKCYHDLFGNINVIAEPPPPDICLTLPGSSENPCSLPLNIHDSDEKLKGVCAGLSPSDLQFFDPITRVRADDGLESSKSSVKENIKKKKCRWGESECRSRPNTLDLTSDARSDQEIEASLLGMVDASIDIDLAALTVHPGPDAYYDSLYDSPDPDQKVDKIARKIMELVILPNRPVRTESLERSETIQDNSPPELPWCTLCNKYAQYRCFDCDNLYCAECNLQVHKTNHKIIEYKPK